MREFRLNLPAMIKNFLRLASRHLYKRKGYSILNIRMAPFMKKEFPEVEQACRLYKISFLLSNEARNIKFSEPEVWCVDASILQLFDLSLIRGDAKTALSGPGKMIISETEAGKYFGKENPVGKVLTIHDEGSTRPFQGFSPPGDSGLCDCRASDLAGDGQLAAGFCLPDRS